MLRILTVGLILPPTVLLAAEPEYTKLAAPAGWGGETIQLPPGFAPDMKLWRSGNSCTPSATTT